jgi:opacity protein-like surface antigen
MMKHFPLLLILLFVTLSTRAQEVPKVDVFGGYSYVRADLGDDFGNLSGNLHGWNGSVTYNFDRLLGIKADFSGQTGGKTVSIPITGSLATTQFDTRPSYLSFLFGPQLTYRKKEKVTPFGHILLGGVMRKARFPIGATQTIDPTTTTTSVSFIEESDIGFGVAFGGGMDVRLSKRASLRAFQVDYLLSRVSGGTQSNIRVGTGLVLRFGRIN